MTAKQRQSKMRKVMKEFAAGTLKSGSGEVVKNRKQALAIALSEAGMSKGDKSDAYWDAYIDTMCGSMSKENAEEEMDESAGEKRCKGYLAAVKKNKKK